MKRIYYILLNVTRDMHGVTALEYGLIAAMIFLVVIGGVRALGTNLSTMMSSVNVAM
jgi:pilus assembly protein Flp/PilA